MVQLKYIHKVTGMLRIKIVDFFCIFENKKKFFYKVGGFIYLFSSFEIIVLNMGHTTSKVKKYLCVFVFRNRGEKKKKNTLQSPPFGQSEIALKMADLVTICTKI